MPIVDPASLPTDPAQAPEARLDVPVLIGTSADEGTFFFRAGGRRLDPDDARLAEMVAHLAHADDPHALIADARAPGRDRQQRRPLPGRHRGVVRRPGRSAGARLAPRPGAPFTATGSTSPPPRTDLGATHSLSVPLLFGTWRDGGVARRLAGDGPDTAQTTEAIQRDWRAFVHGEPLGTDTAVYGTAR